MCVVMTLLPGQMIDEDKLDKAVANNWNGFGVVLKDEDAKRLEVIRHYSESEGADPEKIARIIEENNDITRYVHLRHTTAGTNSEDNCHPFSVYNSNSRQVLAMHNGTIYGFKPAVGDTRSDTRIFCEQFLAELLLKFEGEYGKADYNDPVIKTIIEKMIGNYNRVLLVSNDLNPLYCGHWKVIKNKDGSDFLASNDDYFSYIKRGPRHTAVTPFRGPYQHQQQAPYGTQAPRTTTVIGIPGSSGSTGSVKTTEITDAQVNRSLVEEAKTARETTTETKSTALVKLSDVNLARNEKYTLPKVVNDATYDLFGEYGYECFEWASEDELVAMIRNTSPIVIVELIRNLAREANGYEEEADIADQQLKEIRRELAAQGSELLRARQLLDKFETEESLKVA